MDSSLEAALKNLNIQDVPNFRGMIKKFGVVEFILRRKFKGQPVFKHEAVSMYEQKLTDVQEESLIKQINKLTDKGIFSTRTMVKNFAEKIIKDSMGKNWTNEFV